MRIKNSTHTTEKPKAKRNRKSKDRAGKRVAREQSRLELEQSQVAPTPQQDEKGRTYYLGSCMPTACGQEAACMPTQNKTHYYCLCPNNGEPPTEDFKCSRSTVPLTPKPIYNVMPPITSNFPSDLDSSTAQAAVAVGGALFVLLVICVTVGLLRRRYCRVAGKAQPRIRPGEPLLAERYITNPQYGVCSTSALAASALGNAEDGDSLHVPLIDRNALTFVEEVGEGCFGKVHKGLLRLPNEEQIVAVKVLKESAGRSAEEDFVREVSIMSAFRHPNILSLIGVVYKDNISASPWMVFEYMEWGDLAGVLRGSRNGGRAGPELSEPALLHVALQVARGMQYLASIRFVHRDLAARNCLVGAQLSVKIADFGMSRDIYTCDYYKMGGQRPMPVRWMSPESIVYARFTHESDVWSYGVVLWEIYSRGKQPFYGHNNDGATKLILRGIILVPPEDCPRFACDLMRACWRTNPQERVTFDEICSKLEDAADSLGATPVRLPRPPPLPQDAEGYLKPTPPGVPADYVIPLSEPETDSASSDDEEYT